VLISKKTHCYHCKDGAMERSNLLCKYSDKIRWVQYKCTTCGSSSKLHLKGFRAGLVEMYPSFIKNNKKG